jgi:hypothetical protein
LATGVCADMIPNGVEEQRTALVLANVQFDGLAGVTVGDDLQVNVVVIYVQLLA